MIPIVKVALAIGIPVGAFLLFRKKPSAAASIVPPSPAVDPFVVPSVPKPAAPAQPAPISNNPDDSLPPGIHVKEENPGPFPERSVEPADSGILDSLAGFFGGGTEVHVDGGVSPGFKEGAPSSGGSSGGGGSSDGFFDNLFGPPEIEVDQDGGLGRGFSEG